MNIGKLIRFVVAGGTAAAANFGSRILFSEVMSYAAAIVLAYLVGMTTAFILNRVFVFKGASNQLRHQVAWFVLINLLAVAQTLAISVLLARLLLPWFGTKEHAELLAHAIGVVVPIFTSYIGHSRLSFRDHK